MKRLRTVVICILIIVSVLSGCSEERGETVVKNTRYTLIRRPNGECYLDIPNDFGKRPGLFGNPNAYFQDIKALKTCIMEGTFPKNEFDRNIATKPRNDLGKLIIFDPENLYDAVLPEKMKVYKMSSSIGPDYTFYISGFCGEDLVEMSMSVCLEVNCNCLSERHREDRPDYIYPVDEVLSKTQSPDGARTEYIFRTGEERFREVQRTYTNGEDKITFVEEYRIGSGETLPSDWKFYGVSQGKYFSGNIEEYDSHLDLSYLSTIGLTPYVEPEAA